MASYEPRLDHVQALLEAGADVSAELPCGFRPCDVVNHSQTRRMLASHGGAHAPYQNTASRIAFRAAQSLLVALQNCNFTDMRRAISEGASVHTTDMMGNSALHRAVLAGSAADVVWLMQSGACLSGQCWSGDTPLHLAVSSREQTMIDLLLSAGADPLIENAHGCCCVRLAARMANMAAWEALTAHISARRCAESAPPAGGLRSPHPGVRGRLPRHRPPPEAPPLSADEFQRREAAAEAAAAELIAGEAAEEAQRARKELQRTKRRLKKQRARLQKLEEAAGELHESADDDEGDGGQQRASSPDEDELVGEPDWIADLLDDFDAGSDAPARRAFIESSVRLCASLKLQLENVQRCVVCLDGARGTVLQPCGHAQLCRSCAARVTDGEPEAAQRCPVCLQGVTGWAPAFL